MSNVNNLTSKILREAKEKCDEILGSSREEEAKIVDKKIAEAKIVEEDIISKANREAATMQDRIISNAELTSRNKKLAAKQVIIDKVFEKALENLNNIPAEEYINFTIESIKSMELSGDYNLVIGENAFKFITPQFTEAIDNALLSTGKKAKVTLNSNPGNFKGGFILEKGGIEINNTFEALLSSMRDKLEYEVTRSLFS